MNFAVVSTSFTKYSETFIRTHADCICPDSTALVALNSSEFPQGFSELKSLSLLPRSSFWPKKVSSVIKLIVDGSVYYCGFENSARLKDFFKKNQIKVVLSEYGPVGCAVASACRQAGVKHYVHFHGYDASMLIRHWHVRHSYKKLYKSAAGFIFPSNFLAKKLCNALKIDLNNRIHVVPCCVQSKEFNCNSEKDENLLLSVGRFVPKKAPDKTIRAFAKVLEVFPAARLEMIGDGVLLHYCESLVKTLGVESSVVFHGSKPHEFVKEKMERASLFLQHSVCAPNGDVEGLPVAVLEAMAAGAVVVATKHSGIPEAVVDGETGMLVEEHDVEAMSRKCIELLQNKELLSTMRDKARKRVEDHYTVERQILLLRNILGLKV